MPLPDGIEERRNPPEQAYDKVIANLVDEMLAMKNKMTVFELSIGGLKQEFVLVRGEVASLRGDSNARASHSIEMQGMLEAQQKTMEAQLILTSEMNVTVKKIESYYTNVSVLKKMSKAVGEIIIWLAKWSFVFSIIWFSFVNTAHSVYEYAQQHIPWLRWK